MTRVLLVVACGLAASAEAANVYVRQGAAGNGSGSDWTNAFGSLPADLTRGDVYYVADGTYGPYTFDDGNSGSTPITVKKATIADHGTDFGWSNSYGDGQAVFGGFTFVTDFWTIDGSTRNENAWNDGPSYGIKVESVFTNYFAFGHASDNVTLKYLDIGLDYGDVQLPAYNTLTLIYLGGFVETAENWLVQRCYLHNANVIGQHAGVHSVVYEYNFIGPNWSKTAIRHQGRGSSVTIRYNVFRNACQGNPNDPTTGSSCTAIVGWYGNAGSINEDYSNSAVYGNMFIDTRGVVFYNAVVIMGDDRSAQGGGPQNCSACKTFNNTFIGMGRLEISSQIGLRFAGNIVNSEARNNIFYDIGNRTAFCSAAACSNNPTITDGGIFVNPGGENFQLAADGAAGIGNALSSPYNADMRGNIRGADGTWDLGAFEFVSGRVRPVAPLNLRVR
ncbi:MAG: hypothetical protein ACOZIN_17185 [Myxococcota bacterium]